MQEASKYKLQSRVIETKLVRWEEFEFIQQDDFKELPEAAKSKLKQSILSNEFTQPFYVWQDTETQVNYCLDGKHRTMILEELSAEGHDIPEELPATFIDCKDKQEAAKLVLVYSSLYAKITETGMSSFLDLYDLDRREMNLFLDLPGLDMFLDLPTPINAFDDSGIGVKNQFGVIVMCDNEEDQEEKFNALSAQGFYCKVVVT